MQVLRFLLPKRYCTLIGIQKELQKMNVIVKLSLLFLCCGMCSATPVEEELKCNLRYCGAELLSFEKFTIGQLFRKMELANFCVKNCTPPVVHEFFQSIIYSVTKRIPGHCSGEDCVDQNRFVALAKCVEDEAWPLLQCAKTLIDLAHIGLIENPAEEKRNTTCRIVTETVQCIEETLQRCGDRPFQLVKEILGDLINAGIVTYCHPAYRKQGWLIKPTVFVNLHSNAVTIPPSPGPNYKHPQFVKGYRPDSAPGLSNVSYVCLLLSITLSFMFSVHHAH